MRALSISISLFRKGGTCGGVGAAAATRIAAGAATGQCNWGYCTAGCEVGRATGTETDSLEASLLAHPLTVTGAVAAGLLVVPLRWW